MEFLGLPRPKSSCLLFCPKRGFSTQHRPGTGGGHRDPAERPCREPWGEARPTGWSRVRPARPVLCYRSACAGYPASAARVGAPSRMQRGCRAACSPSSAARAQGRPFLAFMGVLASASLLASVGLMQQSSTSSALLVPDHPSAAPSLPPVRVRAHAFACRPQQCLRPWLLRRRRRRLILLHIHLILLPVLPRACAVNPC